MIHAQLKKRRECIRNATRVWRAAKKNVAAAAAAAIPPPEPAEVNGRDLAQPQQLQVRLGT